MNKKYKVIVNVKGHVYESGATSPNYVTVCKKPHWDTEGTMLQGSLADATKFEVYDGDVNAIFEYVKKKFEGKREFAIVEIDERILGTPIREIWGTGNTKGDFDETGMINGNFVREVLVPVNRGEVAVVDKLKRTTDCVAFLRELNFCNDVKVRPDFLECFEYAINNKGNLSDRDRDIIRGYYISMLTKSAMSRNLGGTVSSINYSLRNSIIKLRRSCGNLFDVGLKEYLKQEEACLKDMDRMYAKSIGELDIDSAMLRTLKKNGYLTIGDIMNAGSSKLLEIDGFGTVSLSRLRQRLSSKGLALGD